MNTSLIFRLGFLVFALVLFHSGITNAQMAKMSFNNAYSMLNSGSKSSISKTSSMGSVLASINSANYTKKVQVSYGLPIEIVFEYAAVKSRLESDMASDPDTYNNSSDNVQQAFVNLAYGDFVKISDYNKVNVKLNFRFNPAKLVVYGSDESDFVNNTKSSPWDVSVYKTPNTPVSGSKIMIIKK